MWCCSHTLVVITKEGHTSPLESSPLTGDFRSGVVDTVENRCTNLKPVLVNNLICCGDSSHSSVLT